MGHCSSRNPPAKEFDEKYNTLMEIYIKSNRVKALPHLETAALKAAELVDHLIASSIK